MTADDCGRKEPEGRRREEKGAGEEADRKEGGCQETRRQETCCEKAGGEESCDEEACREKSCGKEAGGEKGRDEETRGQKACGEEVSWIGIDPLIGHQTRRYPFVQGIGEYLPFRSSVFDATLYSLVLSNMLDPHLSMQQAHRVMKPSGKLYIRYFTARIDPRYLIWKMLNSLGILWPYNQFYRWVFTNQSLQHLLRGTGFELAERVLLCDVCPISQQCPDAGSEYFVTGRRV